MRKPISAKQAFLNENLRKGEVYAGIVLGENGAPDYHLFAQRKIIKSATFDEVKTFVEKVGGQGATRRDLALLRINASEHFHGDIFWSCEQLASFSSYAWYLSFVNGFQFHDRKNTKLSGVAVRRLFIQ